MISPSLRKLRPSCCLKAPPFMSNFNLSDLLTSPSESVSIIDISSPVPGRFSSQSSASSPVPGRFSSQSSASSPVPGRFSSQSSAMKFIEITKLSPKRLFGSKKAVSRSHPPSFSFFSSSTSSSYKESSLHEHNGSSDRVPGSGTPVSVLPGEWSDTDRGGFRSVSRTELEALLSRDEAALIMSEAGCGGDSCISLDDLIGRIGSVSGPVCDSELRETFEFFDTDHDGRITAEELLGVFTTVLGDEQCTLEDCRRMVKAVGRSGAGMVFLEDFIRMMEIDI